MHILIQAFKEISQEPNQIPPIRKIDHKITLKEGIELINMRPYWNAYFEKR